MSTTHSRPPTGGAIAASNSGRVDSSFLRLVTRIVVVPTLPSRPSPGGSRISLASRRSSLRFVASSRTASARGCREYCSMLAVRRKISSGSKPACGTISISLGSPMVSVPVLSKMATVQVSIISRTAGSLMMMPRRADKVIAPMMATGIAMSSGHGVATTRTARKRVGSPLTAQAASAIRTASGVYQAPSWSPSRRMLGRCCSESRITCMILA